jgi:pancreatic triacylglycerol lipase
LKKYGLQLGRITGLDPAEPHFEYTDPIVRLDETDAYFVDVIHTDANPLMSFGLGLWQKSGHLDFYPNGGRYHQNYSYLVKYTNKPNNKRTKKKNGPRDQETNRPTNEQKNK